MAFDWKDTLRTVAPGLAAVAGGPLWGSAVKILADKVLGPAASGDPVQDEATLAGMLSGGIPPELRAKIVEADNALKVEAIKAATRSKEIAADLEKAYVADVADARKAHNATRLLIWMAIGINALSYITIAGVIVGCFVLMSGRATLSIDPGIAAMLGGLIGAAVTWVTSNAIQANGFCFGSSPGSRQLAADLGQAAGGAVKAGTDARHK